MASSGIFAREQRGLTIGLVLVLVVIAFEGLAVTTVMPVTVRALQGLALYAWAFSGFMAGSLVGTLAAGDLASRRGAVFAFIAALAIFAFGLFTCGAANTMLLFIAGRVMEGIGAGAVRSLTWFAINQAYSARDHVRMGAALSSAYIVPTLIGPTAAGIIAEVWGWRVVFLALLPLVPIALWLIAKALENLAAERATIPAAGRSGTAIVLAGGVVVSLVGLDLDSIPLMAGLVFSGVTIAYIAARRVLPAGTLKFTRGLPAILAMRGVLTYGYFGSLAFFPMALELVRGLTPTLAGIGISAGSIGWTTGSWTSVALEKRFGIIARPRVIGFALALIIIGTAGTASALVRSLPVGLAIVSWGLAGLGMGIGYNTNSVLAIQAETEHSAATITSSMQLTDSLGQVLGTGMGGVALGTASWLGWSRAGGIAITFGLTLAVCAAGILLSPRLASTGEASPGKLTPAEIKA